MTGMRTCRFCGHLIPTDTAIRFSTRHYSHQHCWLSRRTLEALPTLELERLSESLLRRHGLLEACSALLRARRRQQLREAAP